MIDLVIFANNLEPANFTERIAPMLGKHLKIVSYLIFPFLILSHTAKTQGTDTLWPRVPLKIISYYSADSLKKEFYTDPPEQRISRFEWSDHGVLIDCDDHWEYWTIEPEGDPMRLGEFECEQVDLDDDQVNAYVCYYSTGHGRGYERDAWQSEAHYFLMLDLKQRRVLADFNTAFLSKSFYYGEEYELEETESTSTRCPVEWHQSRLEIEACTKVSYQNDSLIDSLIVPQHQNLNPGSYFWNGEAFVRER